MKAQEPKSIGDAITSALENLGFVKKIKQYEVLDLWGKVVGDQIANVTIAERIDDGKLFVRVQRAPWRNELVFLKKELIGKLNAAIHEDIVKDIIFR